MTCILKAQSLHDSVSLAAYLVPGVVGALLLSLALPLVFIYWRRLAGDLATYKQIWHKRRYLRHASSLWHSRPGSAHSCFLLCLPHAALQVQHLPLYSIANVVAGGVTRKCLTCKGQNVLHAAIDKQTYPVCAHSRLRYDCCNLRIHVKNMQALQCGDYAQRAEPLCSSCWLGTWCEPGDRQCKTLGHALIYIVFGSY